MLLETRRFGVIEVDNEQLLLFPGGLIGLERLRQWALLPDPSCGTLAWLQSTSQGDVCLPVISPRVYFPDYRARVAPRGLDVLKLRPGATTYLLATISQHAGNLTANLRSPLVINMDDRLGIQTVTSDDQPLRQTLPLGIEAVRSAAA